MTITDGREEEHEEAGCRISFKVFRFHGLRQYLARSRAENTLTRMSDL